MAVAIVLTLGTLIAAWAGFIIALVQGSRLKRLEAQVALLSRAAAAAPSPVPAEPPAASFAPPPGPEAAPAPRPAALPEIVPATGRPSWYPDDDAPAPAAAPPPPPRPRVARGESDIAAFFRALEKSLAGNWLVWVAGAALALGGLLLAKYALDRGLFGPWMRIGLAALAGAAMLAAGEWLRRKPEAENRVRSLAPAVLSAAGLITLYGDAYAAFAAFDLIPGPLAFALLAAISAGALFLAWLHGPVIAAFGVAGGFAAPLLIGSDAPNAAALFAYVFAVTAASLAMARFARWRWTAWLSLAGGAGWPALWLLGAYDPAQALALAIYLPMLAAAAIAFAWQEARTPPPMRRLWPAAWNFAPPSVLAAYACYAAALALALWLASLAFYRADSLAGFALVCALGLAAAWRRESFAFFPVMGAAAASLAVWLWPAWLGQPIPADGAGPGGPLAPLLPGAAGLAALFAVGGGLAQARLRLKGPMAAAAASTPVACALILAFTTDAYPPAAWGALLAVLALIHMALTELLARRREPAPASGPVAAYALAACAAALGAVIVMLGEAWLGAAIAAEAAAAAFLLRRWGSPALVWASALLGLGAVYQLTLGADYLALFDGGALECVLLVLAYALAVAALEAASRLLRWAGRDREPIGREHWAVRTLDGAAAALGVAALFIALRLALRGGDLTAPYNSLWEAGLQSSLWLAIPLALRLRVRGRLTLVQRAAEAALIALAAGHILVIQLLVANPWLGLNEVRLSGPTILNPLLATYALPAALVGGLAIVWRRRGFASAPYAAACATLLGFVWLTLEVRRAFHAPDLSGGAVGDAEGWAYSASWLAASGAVLALGVIRRLPILRYLALTALTLTTLKVFLIDLAGLEGLWRALSFLGLGAALMAIAVLYQRVVLPGEDKGSNP